MRLRLAHFVLILSLLSAHAQSQSLDARKTMIDSFVAQRAKNSGLYQSPPINHLVPAFNTITYAGQFEEVDLTLQPETIDGFSNLKNNVAIEVKGFRLEPHLALSLKNVSIGFSIQRDKLTESYQSISGSGTNSFEQRQNSALETSGLGLNTAFVPFPKLHKKLKLALIFGGKSLNVTHKISSFKQANGPVSFEESDFQTFRYTVNQYAAGINLSWFIMKNFALVPWTDYSYTDLNDAKQTISEFARSETTLPDTMEGDWNLFFLSNPKLRYGMDFAVQILGLEIRIGGLLGSVANLNKKVEYITDKSLLLSVSVEQAGN